MLTTICLIGLNSIYICSICGILGYSLIRKDKTYDKVKIDDEYVEVIL